MPPILFESERLAFRQFALQDAPGMVALNAAPEVLQFTGDKPFASLQEAEEFVRNYNPYASTGYGRWAVLLKPTLEFIGFCGLRMQQSGDVDLGYRILKSHWNRGFATEAGQACLTYGFEQYNLPSIVGRVAHGNAGSIRVLEKLSMALEGEIMCDELPGVQYRIYNPTART